MLKLKMATFGLLVVAPVPPPKAHHGFAAHFDPDQRIRIEGTVKQFDFINPHSFLLIDSSTRLANQSCTFATYQHGRS